MLLVMLVCVNIDSSSILHETVVGRVWSQTENEFTMGGGVVHLAPYRVYRR